MKQRAYIILCLFLGSLLFACQPGRRDAKLSETHAKRGVVVYPSDIISIGSANFVELIGKSDINLLGIHSNTITEALSDLRSFIESEEGKSLLEECEEA